MNSTRKRLFLSYRKAALVTFSLVMEAPVSIRQALALLSEQTRKLKLLRNA